MHDVIVVGARCAGSPLAMLLARRGHRVLLVDRASFPSDVMSTHFMRPPEMARLRDWGVLDRVLASGCPPMRTLTSYQGDFPLTGSPPLLDGIAGAYAPRRTALDKVLVDAAVEAGAELRERFVVEDVLWEDGRAVGVAGRPAGGAVVRERARIVVGADGMRSLVAARVGAPVYDAVETRTTTYYTYWSGADVTGFEAHILAEPPRVVLAFPTGGGLVCTFVQWPRADFAAVRADVEGSVRRAIGLMPHLAPRFADARPAERFRGTADHPNFFRKPHGPGWALVGDAGYHRDAFSAQGIKDAFRDAELLAGAIDAGLSDRCALDEALADYERRRNEAARPAYDRTCHATTFPAPPAEVLRLRAALRGNQADTDRFCGVSFSTVASNEFHAPDNIARILGAGQASGSRR